MFYLAVFIFAQNSFPAISIKTLAVSHELVYNLSTESIYDRTAHPGDLLVAGDKFVIYYDLFTVFYLIHFEF